MKGDGPRKLKRAGYSAVELRDAGYKTGERTVHVGSNPQAREKAIRLTLEWLRAHLT